MVCDEHINLQVIHIMSDSVNNVESSQSGIHACTCASTLARITDSIN